MRLRRQTRCGKVAPMEKIIAVVGPTASGKTALGIALAKKYRGEIISADSRQIYQGMDAIADIPNRREQGGIPHHLLRTADPRRPYGAGRFAQQGRVLISRISARGHVPIVIGGTGFYAEALLGRIQLPEVPPNVRLRKTLSSQSAAQLSVRLRKIDPRRAAAIDFHNRVRLIRAIEIATALGSVPLAAHAEIYDVLWIGLAPAQDALERRMRARVKARLKKGAVAEAKKLRTRLGIQRFGALGAEFSLLGDYIDMKLTRQELEAQLVQWELKYAVRQMRYLRRNGDIRWVGTSAQAHVHAKKFLAAG